MRTQMNIATKITTVQMNQEHSTSPYTLYTDTQRHSLIRHLNIIQMRTTHFINIDVATSEIQNWS